VRFRWSNLAAYTDALTEVFGKHGTRARGTPRLGCTLMWPYSGYAASGLKVVWRKCARLRGGLACGAQVSGSLIAASTAMGCARGEWIEWQFRAGTLQRLARDQATPRSRRAVQSGKIIDPPRMDEGALFRFATAFRAPSVRGAAAPAGVGLVGLGCARTIPSRGDYCSGYGWATSRGGFAKAIEMCNNNGHCRKIRRGHHVPELSCDPGMSSI